MQTAVLAERFGDILTEGEPLHRHTTIGVGGPARLFFAPRDLAETRDLLAALTLAGVPIFVLGGGSNLIVRDTGFEGAVVNLSALAEVQVAGTRIRCGAGAPLARVAKRALTSGLSGMEGLVGIPGTIGGAVYMNSGGRTGDIAQVVESALVLDRRGGEHRLTRDQIGFRYRGSALGELVVVEATLDLTPAPKERIVVRMGEVIRKKHESQPMGQKSAGCIFKNPAPDRAAAMLIDRAGLKGEREGGCEVSRRHANFIVNDAGASAGDIFKLVAHVRREVLARFGAALSLEVKVLGPGGLEAA